jgi:DNA-directed RNA polymerase alpha subunit
LSVEGIKTVGEIREKSDGYLLSFQNLGKRSIEHLRITLGRRPSHIGGTGADVAQFPTK